MPASAAVSAPLRIEIESPSDGPAVAALVLAAFGPGRFAKTAERVREQAGVAAGFVAHEDGRLIGSVRLWSIRVGDTPALFLGPIAVDAVNRRAGLGADLVQVCIDRARAIGAAGVLLIGDPPYFTRFGFRAVSGVTLPGPVDPARLMWLSIAGPAPVGVVRPA